MPPTRILGRAALEVIMTSVCLFGVASGRGYRVSPYNRRLVSVALFRGSGRGPHRTAVSRYPALRRPDLPRCTKHRGCPAHPAAFIIPLNEALLLINIRQTL